MYGVAGERRLTEYEVPWLAGYEGSAPVRVGNAAHGQRQLDVYGEVLDALYTGRRLGLAADATGWSLECQLVAHLETIWDQPDDGIWEVRGPRRHFTHSKVMAWVALDRIIRSAQEFGLDGPVAHWIEVCNRIHDDVCRHGFDAKLNSFVQSYGSGQLDASLLMIATVGFLPASDPRVAGTVAAIERTLLRDGFVLRYDTGSGTDGLPPGEGAFLACSSACATMSGCWRRSTTTGASGRSATSRRRSRTSRWSAPRTTCSTPMARRTSGLQRRPPRPDPTNRRSFSA